jgi:two-component system NtrC family response regulator
MSNAADCTGTPAGRARENGFATRLLIVSPDAGLHAALRGTFIDLSVETVIDVESAALLVAANPPDVILLDVRAFPAEATGPADPIGSLLAVSPTLKVIAFVGEGRRDQAARAISAGAADFYHLPLENQVLPVLVRRALRLRELEQENRAFRDRRSDAMAAAGIIASSAPMLSMFRTIEKMAPTDSTVLLLGESGTGKELIARALHSLSDRANRPFCAINCAAIPENLLETELFGHEKGAFTGAVRQVQGRFELASGGTVFLDEIGEMAPSLQAKLLRVLQERIVERVGGRNSIPLDIRVVCATNKELSVLIAEQRFREDLYYRVCELTVRIPPLRQREGDAVLLARYFLLESARRNRRAIRGFTPDALNAIQLHPWPGNVRELENRVNSAVIMAETAYITALDLDLAEDSGSVERFQLREVRRSAERQAVRRALMMASGNLSRAAVTLGVTRPTLYDLLERLQIDSADFADAGKAVTTPSASLKV